jgi:hypothetical protein
MYCTNCGVEDPERGNFCFSCGTALRQGRATGSPKADEAVIARAEDQEAFAPDVPSPEPPTSSNAAPTLPNEVVANEGPSGVDGWLLFLDVALLFINPVVAVYALSQVIKHHDTIGVVLVAPLIVGVAILGVVAGWQLKELHLSGIRLARIYFTIGLCGGVVATGLATAGSLLRAAAGPSAEGIGEALGQGIAHLVGWCLGPIVWLAYLSSSKRVRNTYFQGQSTHAMVRGRKRLRRRWVMVWGVLLAGALAAVAVAVWTRAREAEVANALADQAQTWRKAVEESHEVPPLPAQLLSLLPPDARPALEANVQLMHEIGALPERDVYAVLKEAVPARDGRGGDPTAIRAQIQARDKELQLLSVYGKQAETGYAALENGLASGTIPPEARSFAKGLAETRAAFQQFLTLRRSKATAELDLLNFLTTSAGGYYLQDGKLISRSDRWLNRYGKLIQVVDAANAALLKFIVKTRGDAIQS